MWDATQGQSSNAATPLLIGGAATASMDTDVLTKLQSIRLGK
jgi:hypothetical protein